MRTARIIRLETSPHGTLSTFLLDAKMFCVTLEPPWRLNEQSISCIPEGQYICKRVASARWTQTFEIQDIWKRSLVRFHPGNAVSNTRGCPLVGQYVSKLNAAEPKRALLNSGETFKQFMDALKDEVSFHLTITNAY